MSFSNLGRSLLKGAFGVAGIAALVFAGSATSANASAFLSGSFHVSVYTGLGGGDSGNPQNQANQTNPLIAAANLLGSGVYSGDLNFAEDYASNGGVNTVGAFLQSADNGSSFVSSYYNAGLSTGGTSLWDSTNVLSTSSFTQTTVWVITGNLGAGTSSGTISHDDGASIYDGAGYSNYVAGSANPNTVTTQNYNGLTGPFEIIYVEANGLPADLIVTSQGGAISNVPLPAALPLFASGLGMMGLLGWRKKRRKHLVQV